MSDIAANDLSPSLSLARERPSFRMCDETDPGLEPALEPELAENAARTLGQGLFDEVRRSGERLVLRKGRLRYHVPVSAAAAFLRRVLVEGLDGITLDPNEEDAP